MSTLTIFTAAETTAAGTTAPAAPATAVTVPATRVSGDRRIPSVLGSDLEVPVKGGRLVRYANLDYAASAPCLEPVSAAAAGRSRRRRARPRRRARSRPSRRGLRA
ncbi:hypothetical protein AB0P04_40155, partial [Streptomyces anulatus]